MLTDEPPDDRGKIITSLFEELQYETLYQKQHCKEFNKLYHIQEEIFQEKHLTLKDRLNIMEFWKFQQLKLRCLYCFGGCDYVIVGL